MKSTYIIGEIGQNHNGSVDVAKLIIDVASRPVKDDLFGLEHKSMDAVKLTKRDLKAELSASQMERPYNSPHSFGKTYGEHRAFLELSDEQHFELYQYAKAKSMDFVETLCAKGCLSLLKLFTPDRLKVASRDLTNLPLLEAMAETKIPMILSTGMGGTSELDNALDVITRYHGNISILHCLSEYPSQYKNINLKTILFLKNRYPKYVIGYSDHSIGISIPLAAVSMGAEVIEKHITLDRKMKGTDQAGSLGLDGIWRMMRDIRNLELAIGEEKMFIHESVIVASHKLERSIASNKLLPLGHTITEADIHLLSPGDGIKWVNRKELLGKKVKQIIPKDEIIYPSLIE
jgi:3-deoxy-D-glycero-D-galacto-nononate 9-phosphate synthase